MLSHSRFQSYACCLTYDIAFYPYCWCTKHKSCSTFWNMYLMIERTSTRRFALEREVQRYVGIYTKLLTYSKFKIGLAIRSNGSFDNNQFTIDFYTHPSHFGGRRCRLPGCLPIGKLFIAKPTMCFFPETIVTGQKHSKYCLREMMYISLSTTTELSFHFSPFLGAVLA